MRTILLIVLALLIAGCGSTRKTESLVTNEAAQDRVTTLRTITTREVVESLPEETREASAPLGTPILIDTDRQRVEVRFDASTGEVRAKATVKAAPVPLRETIVQEQIIEEREVTKDVSQQKNREVDIGYSGNQINLMLLLLLLGIIALGIVLRKIYR